MDTEEEKQNVPIEVEEGEDDSDSDYEPAFIGISQLEISSLTLNQMRKTLKK
jgi:hypothetical protein